MLGLHELNAVLVIAVNLLALRLGRRLPPARKRTPGRVYAHAARPRPGPRDRAGRARAAAPLRRPARARQAPLPVRDARAPRRASPWLYAPPVPARRLAWFVGATLLATALSIRAYTTAMSRSNPPSAASRSSSLIARRRSSLLQLADGARQPPLARPDRLLPRDRLLPLPAVARTARRDRDVVDDVRERSFYGAVGSRS